MTYWLGGATTDDANFDIDPRTGQLKVDNILNYDTVGDVTPPRTYDITVNVADSSGTTTSAADNPMGTATITVTITVTNIDEKPTFSSETGASTIEGMENENDLGALGADAVDTYMATDPEGAVVTFTLSGDDGDKFKLTGDTTGTRALAFEDEPDFENPGDMNRDNVYEVTIVASDGANAAMRDVTVKVTNITELGKLEVMPTQPRVGVELTAELTDSDGVVSGPTWQWYNLEETNACSTIPDMEWEPTAGPDANVIKGATSATYTPESEDNGNCLRVKAEYVDGSYDDIVMFDKSLAFVLAGKVQGSSENMAPEFDGTTAMRYVPEDAEAPDNVGKPVMADDPNDDTLGHMLSGPDAGSFKIDQTTGQIRVGADAELDHETKPTHTVTVTATDPHNASDTITVTIHVTDVDEAPQIFEGSLKVEGLSSVEYAENRTDAVATYMARGTDADSARWSLSGDDRSAFTISGGMLRFRESPDYENPADMGGNNTYMVTVEANVVGNNPAMRTVTVIVTNEIELGTLTGTASVDYAENDTVAVGTYTADGPVTPAWSLSGDDADDFSIGSGMLMFRATPDYENPADMDGNNTYMVTVMAEAGGEMDMMDVTVTVTNVEEMGEVTLWAGTVALTVPPQVGDTITGLVDDDDGVTGESWQWSRTTTPDMMASWMDIDGETNADYTVMEGDTGYYLRVMATYTDAVGTDMDMAYSMPTMMVGAVVDEPGMVTLWVGNDPLTMAPQVGDTITGLVVDPDGSVTGEMWQWSRSMNMTDWDEITGATDATYMTVAMDEGYYLRVMATYTDAVGTAMVPSMPTMEISATPANTAPMFDTETAERMVPENTAAGENVGAPVTAMDADNDTLTYSLGGTDMASFTVDNMGQIMVGAGTTLDADTKATYTVIVTVTDQAGATDTIMVTITVTSATDYDANGDGSIDRDEVLQAVKDYLRGNNLTRDEVLEVIKRYLRGA